MSSKLLAKFGIGAKRKRADGNAANAANPAPIDASRRHVIHYDESTPFPEVFDSEFPAVTYKSRTGEVKTACHWGQRKLMLSEIQLLVNYAKPGVSYHIVYAGSAPGTHLAFLDDLFNGMHTWELVDPGNFDVAVLGSRKNFNLRNEFFTNATAYGICSRRLETSGAPALSAVYRSLTLDTLQSTETELQQELRGDIGHIDVARGTHDIPSMYEKPVDMPHGLNALLNVAMEKSPLMFLSDIRSGSLAHDNFEEHVAENMKAQQCWTEILNSDYAMLKFRLPYTVKHQPGSRGTMQEVRGIDRGLIEPDGTVEYLGGDIVIPIWTRPTSTEGRLVVPRGAFRIRYDVQRYEDQCYFLNAKLRELYHFNHLLSPHEDLDNHFDAAAEVHALTRYVTFLEPELADWATDAAKRGIVVKKVQRVVQMITDHIGCDFEGAIRRRDKLVLGQARHGGKVEDMYGEDGPGLLPHAGQAATATTSGSADGSSAGVVKGASWEAEAKRMIEEARKERLRSLWSRNATAAELASANEDETAKTFWRSVGMLQR